MKTNVTLKVDADLVREAKVLAARRGTSLSRLMSEQLESMLREETGYEAAQRRAVSRLDAGYDLDWSPTAGRDELHER